MEQPLIPSKQERMSVLLPVQSTRRTTTINDTTFVVKLEETPTTDSNRSQGIAPIVSVPTAEVDITPSYSEPKLPARLYFSPTLLQDDDENINEPIQPVLSTIDQNQSGSYSHLEKSRQASRRLGRTFLLDGLKNEEIDKTQDAENIRPKISDEIPFMIQCDPTILPENETHHSQLIEEQKSMVYEKRRTRGVAVRKQKTIELDEPRARSTTRRTGRTQKSNKETAEPIKRQTRKRKQSVSDDGINTTVALRKRKALLPVQPPAAATPPKKTRGKKKKGNRRISFSERFLVCFFFSKRNSDSRTIAIANH